MTYSQLIADLQTRNPSIAFAYANSEFDGSPTAIAYKLKSGEWEPLLALTLLGTWAPIPNVLSNGVNVYRELNWIPA